MWNNNNNQYQAPYGQNQGYGAPQPGQHGGLGQGYQPPPPGPPMGGYNQPPPFQGGYAPPPPAHGQGWNAPPPPHQQQYNQPPPGQYQHHQPPPPGQYQPPPNQGYQAPPIGGGFQFFFLGVPVPNDPPEPVHGYNAQFDAERIRGATKVSLSQGQGRA